MSGYPPSNPFSYPPNQQQPAYPNNPFPPQPYPNTNSPSYPFYPNQQPDIMSSHQAGIPAGGGYPNPPAVSPAHPSAGGYPNSPAVSPAYPSAGGYPNSPAVSPAQPSAGGYPNSPAVSPAYPSAGGYPSGNVPDSAGGVPNPGFITPAVCPSAPDLSQMEKIPGYERLTFDEEIVAPPAMPDWKPETQERKQVENLPSLTEEDVREAALQYVGENCCYGSAPARDMVITNITMMSAFHYKLETFGEKRESAWRFVPYNGGPIDGPMNGPAPRPWDILATPNATFADSKMKMEVPHTAFVKPCHTCVGNGRVRCNDCTGYGKKQCTWCKGRGTRSNFDNEMCTSCNGTGDSRCTWCEGTGQVKCKTCNGKAQLKGFVELIITWANHVDDYISETSNMPRELVRQVTGQTAFEEEYPRVYPIMHAPDEAVRNASNTFISKHSTAFPNERILKQRHNLRLIPIAEVNYNWKEKTGVFYVYGYEHKVYFDSYPQKCCCCSII